MASSKVPRSPVDFAGVRDLEDLTRRMEKFREYVDEVAAGDTHTANKSHGWRDTVDPETGDRVTMYLRDGTWVEVDRRVRPT